MLKKIPFSCLVEDMRQCEYIEVSESGFALPLLDEDVIDLKGNYMKVVQVVADGDDTYVLARELYSYDEQEWEEVSGARRIETNPDREITQDPRQKLRERYPSLVATIENAFVGMPVEIVEFTKEPGIVKAVYDETGEYVVDELMVFIDKPYPAYVAHIVLAVQESDNQASAVKVKTRKSENGIEDDE